MTTPTDGVRTLLDGLDNQLADQHTATTEQINQIISLLGGAPPGHVATLDDVLAELQGFRADFNALVENSNQALGQLHSDNTAIYEKLSGSYELLNSMLYHLVRIDEWDLRTLLIDQADTQMVTLTAIANDTSQINSLLANFIAPYLENIFFGINDLASLQSADVAAPRTPPVLSLVELPSEELQEHCRRVQWMIDFYFDSWLQQVADTTNLVRGFGLSIALGALAASGIGLVPVTVLGGAITAIQEAYTHGIEGIVVAASISRRGLLRQALYDAPNASSAINAWYAAVDTMDDVNIAYRAAWKLLIWSTWFNDLYDQAGHNSTTDPGSWETDGYDGTLCAGAPEPGSWVTIATYTSTVDRGPYPAFEISASTYDAIRVSGESYGYPASHAWIYVGFDTDPPGAGPAYYLQETPYVWYDAVSFWRLQFLNPGQALIEARVR